MSLFKVFDIAGTAMSAQTLRLNTTASNLANADSVSSSIHQTYRARQPVFATLLDELNPAAPAGGVQVLGVVESGAPLQQEYAPDHPMANEAGYIFHPNVNSIEEMANMISASRSYQNNVEMANTSKQLLLRTLQLGQ
ncbi:flagellar basal body rod protein FlgC [Nitrosococcus watsonii]|uniref:Flagellar basal-body rod protein FlgC n=1 Tax=Nitrosococcus watsoni (strain C-113) TaxID=105559 RepID=D8K8D5_NITWC|nr:flagellar basal body rod protein FlgC [Nitrosococcus watsonii]ADJ29055.1 flagellar basal-body rod protein FlgC [Nitrosococcus watsonii C-113]